MKLESVPQNENNQENDIEFAHIIANVINNLVDRGVISSVEASNLVPERIDEITCRCANDFKEISASITDENRRKIRTMLGLSLNNETINSTSREAEIEQTILDMRDYLSKFKKQYPFILGFILCGSRMNPNKMPGDNSDIDVVLILKEGYLTDSGSEEGRKLVSNLVSFTQNNRTSSGFEVELDGFYTVSEFQSDMKSNEYRKEGKLVWGWDSNSTRYIGDNLTLDQNEIDENQLNEYIQNQLHSAQTEALKQQIIQQAKDEIKQQH